MIRKQILVIGLCVPLALASGGCVAVQWGESADSGKDASSLESRVKGLENRVDRLEKKQAAAKGVPPAPRPGRVPAPAPATVPAPDPDPVPPPLAPEQ